MAFTAACRSSLRPLAVRSGAVFSHQLIPSALTSSAPRHLASPIVQLQHRCKASSAKKQASATAAEDGAATVHFRESQTPHPLMAKPHQQKGQVFNDRYAMTLNHIWSQQEIDEKLSNLYQHKPESRSDKIMHGIMWRLYKSFNFITGYKAENTPVKAVEWRLIVLESFAGVPGFMAAMFRHFRSLRTLQRDHGWIHTLLEEAENERMHLLVCMKMFEANFITRFLVISAQVVMTPFLASVYVVRPDAVHRLVGYLEETACLTYANIIHQVETPGTPLHEAWYHLPAPQIAKTYWKLSPDARWVDALKCMFADESNHRDVNHTFASMATDDPNPFVQKHQADAAHAWRLEHTGSTADVGCYRTLGRKASSSGDDSTSVGSASHGGAAGATAA